MGRHIEQARQLAGDGERGSGVRLALDAETREAAEGVETWASRPRRERAKTIANAAWGRARDEALAMMRARVWADAKPRHFAATYELMHEQVYGVLPAELTPAMRLAAAGAAARCLEREFGNDPDAMADYLWWVWSRERAREQRRRLKGESDGFRIGWRLQFNGGILTDYRLAKAREAGR